MIGAMFLALDDVSVRYARGAARAAVDGVTLGLQAGQIGVLIGPSGCGKTSLLRAVAGLERCAEGRVSIDGQALSDAATGLHLAPEKRQIGMVFQDYALFPHLSVADNVAFGVAGLMKPPSDVYEMLSTGVADGTFFARESILTFKLAPLVKHALFVQGGVYNTSFALIMNEAAFAKISPADQQAVMRVSGDAFARLAGLSFEDSDMKGLELLKQAGTQVTNANPALTEELRRATQPVFDAWIKEASAKGVDGRAALEALRAEVKKVPAK